MYSRIVVGTDGSSTAGLAVEAAFALAQSLRAEVHVVTAWLPLPALALTGGAHGAPTPVPDDGAWVRDLHDLLAVQGSARGLAVTTHAVEDGPAHALLSVVDAVGADLVVVGSRGMSGLRGKLGSVPNTVAHKAPCAVLVVPTC